MGSSNIFVVPVSFVVAVIPIQMIVRSKALRVRVASGNAESFGLLSTRALLHLGSMLLSFKHCRKLARHIALSTSHVARTTDRPTAASGDRFDIIIAAPLCGTLDRRLADVGLGSVDPTRTFGDSDAHLWRLRLYPERR